MTDAFSRARRYRHHAEELRTMSQEWHGVDTLQKVLDLASDYDRMADSLEKTGKAEDLTAK